MKLLFPFLEAGVQQDHYMFQKLNLFFKLHFGFTVLV